MLDGLRQFIADVVAPDVRHGRAFDDNDYRLAATALLIHVVSLDGEPSAKEQRKLHACFFGRKLIAGRKVDHRAGHRPGGNGFQIPNRDSANGEERHSRES